MFAEAIWRLGARAMITVGTDLSVWEWLAFSMLITAFGYYEGFRALHQRFVPAVLKRAYDIGPGLAPAALAPFTALGLVNAPKVTLRHAWISVVLIVAAVLAVRAMPEPWRGIVDGAVAVALSIGLVSMLLRFSAWARGSQR
jgi:hypothetical protein